jgi:hypothetical protein
MKVVYTFCPIVAAINRVRNEQQGPDSKDWAARRDALMKGSASGGDAQGAGDLIAQLISTFNGEISKQEAQGKTAMENYKKVACQCSNVQTMAARDKDDNAANLATAQTKQQTETANVDREQGIMDTQDNLRKQAEKNIKDENKRHKKNMDHLKQILADRSNAETRCGDAVSAIRKHTGMASASLIQEFVSMARAQGPDLTKANQGFESGEDVQSSSNGAIQAVENACETLRNDVINDEKNIKDERDTHMDRDTGFKDDLARATRAYNNAKDAKDEANVALAKAMKMLNVAYRGQQMAIQELEASYTKCKKDKQVYDQTLAERKNALTALYQVNQFILQNKDALNPKSNANTAEFIDVSPRALSNMQLSFLQTGVRTTTMSPVEEATEVLRSVSEEYQSKQLSTLVTAMSSKNKHFDQIVNMISDMIAKMQKSVDAQETQHGWCKKQEAKIALQIDQATSDLNSAAKTVRAATDSMTDDKNSLIAIRTNIYQKMRIYDEERRLRFMEYTFNKENADECDQGISLIKTALNAIKTAYKHKSMSETGQMETVDGKNTATAGKQQDMNKQGGVMAIYGIMELMIGKYTDSRARSIKSENEQNAAWTTQKAKIYSDVNSLSTQNDDTMSDLSQESSTRGTAFGDYNTAFTTLMGYANDQHANDEACATRGAMDTFNTRMKQREAEMNALKEAYRILDAKGAIQ